MIKYLDIALAYKIANLMAEIDHLVFSENSIERINLITSKQKKIKSHFMYNATKDCTKEQYVVFVNGLTSFFHDLVERRVLSKNCFFFRKALFMNMAVAHEVRHRCQRLKLIEPFTPENIGTVDFLSPYRENLSQYLRKKAGNRGEEFLNEFDCTVIEIIILNETLLDRDKVKNFKFISDIISLSP